MRGLLLVIIASGALSVGLAAASGTAGTSAEPSGRIAFSYRFWPKNASDNFEIFVQNVADKRSANLTRNPGCDEFSPAWSHSGRWIAFACGWGIHVIGERGTGRRRVVNLPNRRVNDPAWGPADRRLAFAIERKGIWSVNADGKGLRRLSVGRDSSPAWSADGRNLAFARQAHGASNVFRMQANGRGQVRLAKNACCPAWSPDGRSIAFVRNGSPWIMNPGGGAQRRIVRSPGDGVTDLAWSPDGRYLAYFVYCCREGGVYAIAPDGTSRRVLFHGAEFAGIAWGPNP
jgi:Tol biopolymer transport system component